MRASSILRLHWRMWAGIIAGVVCIAIFLLFMKLNMPTPRHNINESTFYQIQTGMSEKAVEQLIGFPPGDYATESVVTWYETSPISGIEGNALTLHAGGDEWIGNEISIYVRFDERAMVVDMKMGTAHPRDQSLLARFSRFL